LATRFRQSDSGGLNLEIIAGTSAIGGGSGPATYPPTALIAIDHATLSADQIEQALRTSAPPVITRIADDRVLIDLRTVAPEEEKEILDELLKIGSQPDSRSSHVTLVDQQ